MVYSIIKLRAFAAMMIAAMVLSIAVPQGVANAALEDIANDVDIDQNQNTAIIDWSDATGLDGKLRIFQWNKNDPDPDLGTSSAYTEVPFNLDKYTVQFDNPGEYKIALVGVDNSGAPTTLPAIFPVDARLPFPQIDKPAGGYINSRSLAVNGSVPNCTGCELYVRIFDYNNYSKEYLVPSSNWSAGKFSTSITIDSNAPETTYDVVGIVRSPSLGLEAVGTYGSQWVTLDATPTDPVTDLQAAFDGNNLVVKWTNPPSVNINQVSGVNVALKRPGNTNYDEAILVPIFQMNPPNEYTFEQFSDLPSGTYEINVFTIDHAGNRSQDSITTYTLLPEPVTALSLQDNGVTTDTLAALYWIGPDADYDHFRVSFKREDDANYDPYNSTVVARPAFWGNPVVFEFGLSPGKYKAKVVTVGANGTESIPQEISLDFTDKIFPALALSGETVSRNSDQYTLKGTASVIYHYFTEIRIYYVKDGVERAYVPAQWNKSNNQFNATMTFADEDTYMLRAYLTNPLNGNRELSFLSPITVVYDPTLPNLPENIGAAVQDSDVIVNWNLPAAPDYEQVFLTLINKNTNSIERSDTVNKDINQYVFEDLLPGTYYVALDVENADGKRSQERYTSNDLVIAIPAPVLEGPAEVKTDSPNFTVNGTAPFCIDCKVFVTVRDTNGNPVEPPIEAVNWSAADNTFSVTSATYRPYDVYAVSAHLEIDPNNKSAASNATTFVYVPMPMLSGPAIVNTSSGIFTISGTAEPCNGCEVIVSIYDQQGNLLEDITATNWSPVDNTFSAKTTVDRPNGTYTAKAAVKLKGFTGPSSNDISIRVAKNAGGGGGGGGSGSGSGSVPAVIAPIPDPSETIFYLTEEASKHDGFKRSIRLAIDAQTVQQVTPVTVRKYAGSGLKLPGGYSAKSDAFALSSDKPFKKSQQLTLYYSNASLNGVNPEKLGIYRQSDTDKQAWIYAGGILNKADNSITATISGTGTFAILLHDITFPDLAKHWSRGEVETLASRHLVHGMSASRFDPERNMTRAEAVKLLVEAAQQNNRIGKLSDSAAVSFTDVASSAWYYEYVIKASSYGMLNSQDGGKFRPDEPITREEIAYMIYRLAQGSNANEDSLHIYKDASLISGWAKQAVAYATHNGILKGSTNGVLDPQGHTTRAQAAAVVLRTLRMWGLVTSDESTATGSLDATIYDAAGKAIGWAVMTPHQDGVRLQLQATGLKPGKHGFHIHEKAFTWLDFKSAGGHFNPDAKKHGHDNPQGHHLGDMPNLTAKEDGSASVDMVMKDVSLSASGVGSLLGKSIIIHAAEDDYKSDPAGNAGDRIAGGIIAE